MKRGLVVVFILLFVPFALAYGDEGDACRSDEGCSGTLVCVKKVCTDASSSVSITTSASDVSVSCTLDEDCFTALNSDYICDSTGYCSEDLDYNGVADAEEVEEEVIEENSADTCVAHPDCELGYACDCTSYTCASLESLSGGSCKTTAECNEGYTCFYRYCLPECSGGSAGITNDNPFLGWADSFVDTAVSYTSNDPAVQQSIAREGLKESQSLDQRRAMGQISENSYAQAKTQSGEKSVQGLQNAYQAISQQGGQGNQRSLQQLNSFSSQVQTGLQGLQSSQVGGQFQQNVQQLQSQLGQVQQSYGAGSSSSGSSQTYSCAEITSDTVVGDFLVSPLSDGSLSLTDSYGYYYTFYPLDSGFEVYGDSILAYVNKETYTGSDIIFTASSTSSSSLSESTVDTSTTEDTSTSSTEETVSSSENTEVEEDISSDGTSVGGQTNTQNQNRQEKSPTSGTQNQQQNKNTATKTSSSTGTVATGSVIRSLFQFFSDNAFAGTGRIVGGLIAGGSGGQQGGSGTNVAGQTNAQNQNKQTQTQGSSGQNKQLSQSSGSQGQGNQFGKSTYDSKNKGQQGDLASGGKRLGQSSDQQTQGFDEQGIGGGSSQSQGGQQSTSGGSFSPSNYIVTVVSQDDSVEAGPMDLNRYGKSVLGLGNSIVYSYEANGETVRLLVGDSLYISAGPGLVEACQLTQVQQEQQQQQQGFTEQSDLSGESGQFTGESFEQGQGQFGDSQQQGNSQFRQGQGQGQTQGQGQGNQFGQSISDQRNQGQQGETASGGQRQGVSGTNIGGQSGVSGGQTGSADRSSRTGGQQGAQGVSGTNIGGQSGVSGGQTGSGERSRTAGQQGGQAGQGQSTSDQRNRGQQGQQSQQKQQQGQVGQKIGGQQTSQQQQKPSGTQQQQQAGQAPSGGQNPPPSGGSPPPPPTGQVVRDFVDTSQNVWKFLFFRE